MELMVFFQICIFRFIVSYYYRLTDQKYSVNDWSFGLGDHFGAQGFPGFFDTIDFVLCCWDYTAVTPSLEFLTGNNDVAKVCFECITCAHPKL